MLSSMGFPHFLIAHRWLVEYWRLGLFALHFEPPSHPFHRAHESWLVPSILLPFEVASLWLVKCAPLESHPSNVASPH